MSAKKSQVRQEVPVFLEASKLSILLIGSEVKSSNLIGKLGSQLPEATFTAHNNEKSSPEHFQLSGLDKYHLIVVNETDPVLKQKIYTEAINKGKLIHTLGHPELSNYHLNGVTGARHGSSAKPAEVSRQQEKRWTRIANWCLLAVAFMLIGHLIFSYISFGLIWEEVTAQIDDRFIWMLLAGFAAQLVDGALGMGYGVISTTVLLSTGLNPAAISGAIHTAEMFSSGASGYSHYRFGNVNKKLFKTLLIPGILGAVIGALLLSYLGEQNSQWVRPALSVYTMILGIRILSMAFKKKNTPKKVKRAGWLAGAGGFLDSFGGGGWGPLVTSTLISKGRTPRIVIGTVSLTEFFVTVSSALTFFLMLGVSHVQAIAGLIIGGLLGAPLAAKLSGKLPLKTMLIGVGIMIIFSSLRIFYKFIF